MFATAGHDKNVALWRRHKLIWTSAVRRNYLHLVTIDFISRRLAMNASLYAFILSEALLLLAAVKVI